MMTNSPEASAVASASVLPSSRNSTLAFGAARPAMTASPVGSTLTASKAGFGGGTGASLAASPPDGEAAGARAGGSAAGAAGAALGAFGSGALARTCGGGGLGHRKSGWVQ